MPAENPLPATSAADAPRLTAAVLAARRDVNRDLLLGIGESVRNRQQAIAVNREAMLRRLTRYRNKLATKCQANLHAGEIMRFRSVEEFIHSYLKRVAPDTDPAVLNQPVGELTPLLTRFDWRSLQIVPEVAEQAGNTCWAETASAAFEASLRRQRANFSTMKQGEAKFTVEVFLLNVGSTLDRVPPFRDPEASGGRHETAFDFYFNEGIPLKEIQIFPDGLRVRLARAAGSKPKKKKRKTKPRTTKAIAWNYVADVNVDDLNQPPSVEAMKRALLEHGPLAVMVARDEAFKNYGRPVAEQQAPANVSLRFRADTFFQVTTDGDTTLSIDPVTRLQRDSLIPVGNELFEQDLVLNFSAEFKPVLETQRPTIPLRPVGADQAVFAERVHPAILTVRIPSLNHVVCARDVATNDVLLHFPANTNMEFSELAGGGWQMRFPKDAAPVFDETTSESENHYVLLIGWDDTKGEHGAWIIQNHQGTAWGYQCNGPTERGWFPQGLAESRGYMYIGYGCNKIGLFAAWVEAQLLAQGWVNQMMRPRFD